jgi:phosphomannomutase
MKIVVDSGNGIPGASAPAILRALGCDVTSCIPRSTATFRTTTRTRASRRTWPT